MRLFKFFFVLFSLFVTSIVSGCAGHANYKPITSSSKKDDSDRRLFSQTAHGIFNYDHQGRASFKGLGIDQGSFFPESIGKKWRSLRGNEKSDKSLSRAIKNQLCNGDKALLMPSVSIDLPIPQPALGTPVDEASKQRNSLITGAKEFLRRNFFSVTVETHSKADMQGEIPNRALDRDEIFFVVPSKNTKSLAKFFLNSECSSEGLGIIKVSDSKTLLLTACAHDGYFSNESKGWPVSSEIERVSKEKLGTFDNHGSNTFFMAVAKDGWDVMDSSGAKSAQIFPLSVYQYSDLAMLTQVFTIILEQKPKDEVVLPLYEMSHSSFDDKVSYSLALENQAKIWNEYFSIFTSVKSSVDSSNGRLMHFEVSLDLNPFCSSGAYSKGMITGNALKTELPLED